MRGGLLSASFFVPFSGGRYVALSGERRLGCRRLDRVVICRLMCGFRVRCVSDYLTLLVVAPVAIDKIKIVLCAMQSTIFIM